MKKKDLERALRTLGWWFKRHGGNHDIWTNGERNQPIPRHKEVNDGLAKKILISAQEYLEDEEENA